MEALAKVLEQYRKETRLDLTSYRTDYSTVAMEARQHRHAEAFHDAATATAVLFGAPLATALREAVEPYEHHIDDLASEVGAIGTRLMMWEDFGRWLSERSEVHASVLIDQRTAAEASLAHLRDEVETAIGDGSTKAAIIERLSKALGDTDPEPF